MTYVWYSDYSGFRALDFGSKKKFKSSFQYNITRKTTPNPPSAMISSAVTTCLPTVQGPPRVPCTAAPTTADVAADNPGPPPRDIKGSLREKIFFIVAAYFGQLRPISAASVNKIWFKNNF